MANTNPKTRRILRAVNWTILIISIVGAGSMLWEIGSNGVDTSNLLILGTFLVVGVSNVLQLLALTQRGPRKGWKRNNEQITKPGEPEAYSVS